MVLKKPERINKNFTVRRKITEVKPPKGYFVKRDEDIFGIKKNKKAYVETIFTKRPRATKAPKAPRRRIKPPKRPSTRRRRR